MDLMDHKKLLVFKNITGVANIQNNLLKRGSPGLYFQSNLTVTHLT